MRRDKRFSTSGGITAVASINVASLMSSSGSNGGAAASCGGTYFINTHGSKMLGQPDYHAQVNRLLRPGTPVTFLGRSTTNPNFAKIGIGTGNSMVTGYTMSQNLSRQAPDLQSNPDDGKPIDPQAFTSSGTATKG